MTKRLPFGNLFRFALRFRLGRRNDAGIRCDYSTPCAWRAITSSCCSRVSLMKRTA